MAKFDFSLYENNDDFDEKLREQLQIPEKKGSFDFSIYENEQNNSTLENKKEPPTWEDSAIDYAKQAAKGTLIGAGGTWGDLAELAGVRSKNKQNASQEYRDIQEGIEKGEKPGLSNFLAIDLDDEGISLPTSEGLEELNDLLGGPGEPTTDLGKLGKRQGKLYGSGLAFGQVNPLPALIAGAAGEGVEKLGGGPIAQAAAEIATLLLTQGRSAAKKGLDLATGEAKSKINELRKLGYSDEQITLAINHASKGKKGGILASKGNKTEQAFENFTEHSNQLVSDILTSEIPGFEQGIAKVHEMASDAYGQVVKEGAKLAIKDASPFEASVKSVIREIKKNLGTGSEAKGFVKRLNDAVKAAKINPSAENYMNFYKELNKIGSWMGRNEKDRLLKIVKNGIKETFKNEGPAGQKLAKRFEEVNKGIRKAYKAEEVSNVIQKVTTPEGIDFKKLNNLLHKPNNIKLFEEVLGKNQTNNLLKISNVSKDVKNFDKSWKAVNALAGTSTSQLGGLGYLIYTGNWAELAAIKGLEATSRIIAEKSLTDPRFQNLLIKGVHAIKNESPRSFRAVNDAMSEYFRQNGIKTSRPKD